MFFPMLMNPPQQSSGGWESGDIRIWNGALEDIPLGWVLCDGQNGTPEMCDRAVVGAGGKYQRNQIFGIDSQPTEARTLSSSQNALHTHQQLVGRGWRDSQNSQPGSAYYTGSYYGSNAKSSGGSQPHEHGNIDTRQKSIAVIWIMKL